MDVKRCFEFIYMFKRQKYAFTRIGKRFFDSI